MIREFVMKNEWYCRNYPRIPELHYVQSIDHLRNRPTYSQRRKFNMIEDSLSHTSVLEISGPLSFHSERISSILAINLSKILLTIDHSMSFNDHLPFPIRCCCIIHNFKDLLVIPRILQSSAYFFHTCHGNSQSGITKKNTWSFLSIWEKNRKFFFRFIRLANYQTKKNSTIYYSITDVDSVKRNDFESRCQYCKENYLNKCDNDGFERL